MAIGAYSKPCPSLSGYVCKKPVSIQELLVNMISTDGVCMAGIIGIIVVIAALMVLDKVKASYYAKKLDEAALRNLLDNVVDLEKGIIRYGGKDFFLNRNEEGCWDEEIFTSGKFRRMTVYGNILHHSWLIAGISGCIAFVFIKLAPQETLAFVFWRHMRSGGLHELLRFDGSSVHRSILH